jgi:hypothetical protein
MAILLQRAQHTSGATESQAVSCCCCRLVGLAAVGTSGHWAVDKLLGLPTQALMDLDVCLRYLQGMERPGSTTQ